MRILHLIDPGSPGGGPCTLRLLADPVRRLAGITHDVLIVGDRTHVAEAERLGIEPVGCLVPPTKLPLLVRRGLKRFVKTYEAAFGRYDLVHAWTARSAVLAAVGVRRRPRLATIGVGAVRERGLRMLARAVARAPMRLLAATGEVRRACERLGIEPERLTDFPPAVDPASSTLVEKRDSLRQRWGVEDGTFVVGLLSEPPRWADAGRAVTVLSLVVNTGRNVRLIAHPACRGRVQSEQWASQIGLPGLIRVDEGLAEPWRVVGGLDAALFPGGLAGPTAARKHRTALMGRRPGPMPLLWAMAASVPVVAEATEAARGIVQDGAIALLVERGDTNAAARALIDLYDDRTKAGRIGARAREAVATRFDARDYCRRLEEVYEEEMTS